MEVYLLIFCLTKEFCVIINKNMHRIMRVRRSFKGGVSTMQKYLKKLMIFSLTGAVTAASLVTSAGAQPTDPVYVKEGTYNYNGTGKDERQLEDHYIYRDDCFMRSSYLGC